jgi:DNA-binding NtrC family response regulator
MAERAPLSVLYVEDETDLRERIGIVLEMHFETVLLAEQGEKGLELFASRSPDVVVCDIMMPQLDGLEMARRIREIAPKTPIIICTAFTETSYLLKAIELGVSAYVKKPLDCWQLVDTINSCAAPILQQKELAQLREREQASLELLLGESQAMQGVIVQAQRVAGTDYSVLIQGETGVGKSHLAQLIHGLSRRRHAPLVAVTISSLAESLVESQLFGHLRGAFTGAVATTRGLFEEADGGTLFLDDVDCAAPGVQAKILHAVEQKQFFPVGGTRLVGVDTRVIAASNRDLRLLAHKGGFREDLYYRLADVTIVLPPLRERGEDIARLARRFLSESCRELGRGEPRIPSDAMLCLCRHSWPGNVRELKSVMKRAALFAGESLTCQDLAGIIAGAQQDGQAPCAPQSMEEVKRSAVLKALQATCGKKMEAARLLQLDYSSFKRLLDRFGL